MSQVQLILQILYICTCIYKYSINILEIPGTAAAVLFIYVYVCEQRAVLANDKNQHTDNQHSTLFYLCFFCFCFLYFFIGIRHSTGEHYYIWYPLRTHDENSTTTWLYSHLVPFIAFIYPLLSAPPPHPLPFPWSSFDHGPVPVPDLGPQITPTPPLPLLSFPSPFHLLIMEGM